MILSLSLRVVKSVKGIANPELAEGLTQVLINSFRDVFARILYVELFISLNTFLIWHVDSSLQNSQGRYKFSETQYIRAIVPSK